MNDRHPLRVAWLCWGAPAVVGVFSTIFFLTTGHFLFVMIGLLCVPVGAILSLLGAAMLANSTTGPRALISFLLPEWRRAPPSGGPGGVGAGDF